MYRNVRLIIWLFCCLAQHPKVIQNQNLFKIPKTFACLWKTIYLAPKMHYTMNCSSSFKTLSWGEQVSSQDEGQMEQQNTLLLSFPEQQNNQVTSADGQHSALGVASFVQALMFEQVSNAML